MSLRLRVAARHLQASAHSDLKSLSPQFLQALKKAVSDETAPKAKAALKEALDTFEEVIDLLKVAQHEAEESVREASFNLEAQLAALNIRGRDDFYTHLITQEQMMWLPMVLRGEESKIAEEIPWLEQRRGFNAEECRALRRQALFFVTKANEIRAGTSRAYQ